MHKVFIFPRRKSLQAKTHN